MPGKRHTHKYCKVSMNGIMVWRCALPNCSHYMPDHLKAMIPGKASICWACNEEFVLDDRAMKMDMPTCIGCTMEINDELLAKLEH